MSNAAGQIIGQIVGEIVARIIVGAIEAGVRSAFASPAPVLPPERIQVPGPRPKRGVAARAAMESPVIGIETVAIVLQGIDTTEADPTEALIAQLRNGLLARHFEVLPGGEADARLFVRHDSNAGRATTVELALVKEATGTVLWKDRSTNGQLSVEAAKWAAEAAMRTMPAKSGERSSRPATSSARPGL
jgi:hypothetical protein